MNKKGYLFYEVTKNDRTYSLVVPFGSPYGEVRDTLIDMFTAITSEMNDLDQKLKEKMAEDKEVKEA